MFTNATDEQLDLLEESLKKVKTRYDLFFAGSVKLPPMEERHRIEAMIHELSRQNIRDNARRFRLNTLIGRFNQFRELWGRRMREREEGPTDFRKRREALLAPKAPPRPHPTQPPASPVTQAAANSYVEISTAANGDAMKQLQTQINAAQKQLGASRELTIEQVSSMVTKQIQALEARFGVNRFAMRVDVVDGKVKLKAKPVQNPI